jgi:hypothetical protein
VEILGVRKSPSWRRAPGGFGRHVAHWRVPDTISEVGRHIGRGALTAWAFGVAMVALVGCSSPPHVAVTQTRATRHDMVACASVDAVFALIARHDAVPANIARRVISSSESADSSQLGAEARALQGDVNKSDDAGVDKEMTALGATCNSLGVGPAKY